MVVPPVEASACADAGWPGATTCGVVPSSAKAAEEKAKKNTNPNVLNVFAIESCIEVRSPLVKPILLYGDSHLTHQLQVEAQVVLRI